MVSKITQLLWFILFILLIFKAKQPKNQGRCVLQLQIFLKILQKILQKILFVTIGFS